MPNPTEISLLNYNFEAKACNELLTAMLNHSDLRTEISAKTKAALLPESTEKSLRIFKSIQFRL